MGTTRGRRPSPRTPRRAARLGLVAVLVAALTLIAAPMPPVGAGVVRSTEWVSVDSGSGGGRELPALSADGHTVVFVGRGESNQGVWLRDRLAGVTYRLTTGSHFNPAISADGDTLAYVVYGSLRSVYVRDISDPSAPGPAQLVSSSATGQSGNGLSDYPSLSADGRYVAFQSTASNLTPETPLPTSGGPTKVYVKDRVTGAIEMVSVDDTGAAQPGNGLKPDITPDGRYVAFASEAVLDGAPQTAAHGVPGSPGGEEEEATETFQQVYRRDLVAGTTQVVSVTPAGLPGGGASALEYGPTISDDGTRIAFESAAPDLVPNDTNSATDVFVRDLVAGTTVRASERTPAELAGTTAPVVPAAVATTALAAGVPTEVAVGGVAGIPADAAAADLVVSVDAAAPGYLQIQALGGAGPAADSASFPAGVTALPVTTALGTDGKVVITTSVAATATVEARGWHGTGSVATGGGTHAAPATTFLDTTATGGTPLGADATIDVPVLGLAGVPLTATAVHLTVTASDPSEATELTAYPGDGAMPARPTLSLAAGTASTSVLVAPAADGTVRVHNAAGEVDVRVDVQGWVDGANPGGGITTLPWIRLADTRLGDPLAAGTPVDVQVTGEAGVPASGVTAVVLQVAALDAVGDTSVAVGPSGRATPPAALAVTAGTSASTKVLVPVGDGGMVSLASSDAEVDLVVDVAAYVTGVQVPEGAGASSISGNGLVVAFESTSATLVDGDANGVKDVFTRALPTAVTERASVVSEGTDGTEASGTRIDGNTGLEVPQNNGVDPDITRDGGRVVFVTNGDLTGERPEDEENPGEVSTEPASFLRLDAFADVPVDYPFVTEIEWMVDNGITTGYPDETFRPTAPVTRQAFAAFLYRYSGSPNGADPVCTEAPFPDVPIDHPFCGEIDWLADTGITGGYVDGTFRPAATVSRQAISAFLYRYAGAPNGADPTCTVAPFSDVPVSSPFCGEITWMADTGLSTGYVDGTFRPLDPVSRQAASAFLYRYDQLAP